MRSRSRLSAAVGALAIGGALLASPAVAGASPASPGDAHGVFVQTNETDGNHVIAYHRNADGSLGDRTTYATGGNGGRVSGAVVDPLASQGGLLYADGRLFAVNAGSDTLTSFDVAGDHLTHREVVPVDGTFPVSVAVHDDLVYVLSALDGGSITGFRLAGDKLHPIHGSTRQLSLPSAPVASSTFLFTPGQVGFTPDGGQLVVTTKASTSAIEVFAVGRDGRPSGTPASTPSAAPVPFGFVFDPVGRLVVGEAGGSVVSTYAIGDDGSVAHVGSRADGQAALCWIAAVGNGYYVGNAGSGSISGYHVDAAGQPTLIVDAAFATPGVVGAPGAGAIDLVGSRDGRFLYAEAGGAGTVSAYRLEADGTLASAGTIGGLPATVMEGIAAN